jgi:hypothetical protein
LINNTLLCILIHCLVLQQKADHLYSWTMVYSL